MKNVWLRKRETVEWWKLQNELWDWVGGNVNAFCVNLETLIQFHQHFRGHDTHASISLKHFVFMVDDAAVTIWRMG